jgi:hypothetical protein
VGLRDGSTANGLLQYRLAVSAVSFNAAAPATFSIVDDDGSDPRLTSSGAQPFGDWPALFASSQTLHTPQGTELPKSAAIGDLNQDGRMDLAVSFGDSSGTWISVWLQQPNGALSSTPLKWTGTHSIPSLAIADVTGDGAAEIIVPQYTELDLVRLVNGQLQTVDAVAMDCWHVAVADLDLDGFNDIVVANARDQSFDGPQHWLANVSVFRGNAQRTLDPNPYRFAAPYNAMRSQLVIGTFDADARPDIAITSSGFSPFPSASIAYQQSDGTFAAPVAVWIAGPDSFDGAAGGDNVTTGDFNGDGRTDLAISSFLGEYLPSVWIFEDLRHDDFSRPTQRLYAGHATSLSALDIDHDGRDDLLVDYSIAPLGPRTPVQVFLQDANGKLTDAGKLSKFGSGLADPWIQKLASGDLDGDGLADAVILDSMDGYVQLMHSSAATQAVQIAVLESSSSVVAGTRARYRLRITNAGARRSLEIPISWSVPQGLATPQIVAAKGACYLGGSSAQCLLPQLDAGGHVDVMLTGSFSTAGSYSMSIGAGPGGGYGSGSVSTTVTAPTSGGGSSSGGPSGGGKSGGGGSFEWLSLAALLACWGWRALPKVGPAAETCLEVARSCLYVWPQENGAIDPGRRRTHDMHALNKLSLTLLLLGACGCAMAQESTPSANRATDANPVTLPGSHSVRVLHEASSTTGSVLRRDLKWSSKIPLDKTYEQLSAKEKADFHSLYASMPPGDEPPFPLAGMRPLFNQIRRGQQIVHAGGRLNLVVTVDAHGKATEVADFGGVEGNNAQQMTQYAGSLLLMTKFKPAVCGGNPCQSQFPFAIDLGMR